MTRKVKTQSFEVKKINRMRNSLSGSSPPPLGIPQFAMVLYYLFWGNRNEPSSPSGTRGALMTNDMIVPSVGADY